MEWLADRFYFDRGAWIDAATGLQVRILIEDASAEDALEWDDQCGRLAKARHPLLNPLIDYGWANDRRRFEAYEAGAPVPGAGEPAERLLVHAAHFLRASGIALATRRAALAMRLLAAGRAALPRPFGFTLQPRRALTIVRETLESPAAAPAVVTLAGPAGSGLRTTRLLIAREARVLGYVPISSHLLVGGGCTVPGERHLCVLDDEDVTGRRDIAGALVKLAAASSRRHVVVRFRRFDSRRSGITLDALPVRALVGMVHGDAERGPGEEELFEAARLAEGRPGAFLAQLQADFRVQAEGALAVHETPQEYVVEAPPAAAPAGRTVSAALRALTRADDLVARGRHALADRVLRRGARVLAGRGRPEQAAECLERAGWLALDRDRIGDAEAAFRESQQLSHGGAAGLRAAAGLGEAWTEEGRLVEAEAVLRGTLGAADAVGDRAAARHAVAGLARCLFRQGRPHDALAAAVPFADDEPAGRAGVRLLATLSRCHAAVGRTGAALKLAREARRIAASAGASRAALADLAVAEALGDTAAVPDVHREAVEALETLLQVSQQASDDGLAIGEICAAVLRRLGAASVMVAAADRRLLACEGRPWVAHSTAMAQALDVGCAAATDAGVEPREAAEAIRYGGEVLGAIACRWTAGTAVDALGAAAVIHAAALAAAAPLRSVLDRGVPAAPATAWGDLLGDSAAATALREAVARAARAPFPVLVEGESGCGKELVARAIHRLGARRERRFCAINCAALTDDLVEAELFGHARGAFTGAAMERAGLFEEADGGTLFLDEVGELSARAQAKLLRVLQEGEVRRVGENFPRRVDVRLVAATNRQLESEVGQGRFRADLRFRLDVIRITVPPLRDRPGDIPVLAAHFWTSASKSVGSQAALGPETLAALARYDWPGNVRELQNVIAWVAVHGPRRGRVGPSSLPAHVAQATVKTSCTLEAAREEFEKRFIRAALANANGERARAAQAMGITRQGLAKMLKRLRIDAP